MAQRQYEPFTLFNVRIVDMRHLWNPSDTYKGKKQDKPNYFAGFIIPKTQASWGNEPALAGLLQAYGNLYRTNPQLIDFRINDGDTPNADGKSSEFAKGHWLFNMSTETAPNVEMVQAGGALVKLPNKVGVKSGDYCMVGGTAAVSSQNSRATKLYLNAVVFSAPGEEIVFANSVSGAELMQQAQRQGLQVTGFSASPGGFGGAPGGFQPQGGGFSPPQQQPFGGAPQGQPGGFTQGGGFAPTMGNPATPAFAAPAQHGPNGGPGGNATFPSNPPQQPAFVPPGGQQWPQR